MTSNDGYRPLNDIFIKIEDTNDYISADIVENSPEYFERVYKVNLISKVVYKLKEEAKEILEKDYK